MKPSVAERKTKTRENGHEHAELTAEELKQRRVEKKARREAPPPEHAHWSFAPELPHQPGTHGLPEHLDHPEDIDMESICGAIDDSQPVEQYDGTLGVTIAFVAAHQSAVGQLQWNNNLAAIYDNPGNVNDVRWCTGTMISNDLFLTAGHCFDQTGGGWQRPLINGTSNVIPPTEIATNIHVNFNYQVDPMGVLKQEESFAVTELVEYRLGGIDFAIVRLAGTPGIKYGSTGISTTDAAPGDMICLIQHPQGLPKRIEAGPAYHLHDSRIGYDSVDTLGGSSGSGILRSPDGKIVGVHTNGGCDPQMIGHNHGQRITSVIAVSPTLTALTGPKIKWGVIKKLVDSMVVKAKISDIGPWKRFNDVKALGYDARIRDPWRWVVSPTRPLAGPAPFVLATPHHAPGFETDGFDPSELGADGLAEVYTQALADLEHAIQTGTAELETMQEAYRELRAEYEAVTKQ